jgi:hypothetical protein
MGQVIGAETRREQDLDRLPDQFLASPAEQPLGLEVRQHDAAGLVADDHGIGGGLQQIPELFLGPLAVGDVLGGADDADRHPVVTDLDPAPDGQPTDLAPWRVQHPHLEGEGSALLEATAGLPLRQSHILGTDVGQQLLVAGHRPARLEPVEPDELRRRRQSLATQIPLPAPDPGDALRFGEASPVGAELLGALEHAGFEGDVGLLEPSEQLPVLLHEPAPIQAGADGPQEPFGMHRLGQVLLDQTDGGHGVL